MTQSRYLFNLTTPEEMAHNSKKLVVPDEFITSKIYMVRDKKVMLDEDLAELYEVETFWNIATQIIL